MTDIIETVEQISITTQEEVSHSFATNSPAEVHTFETAPQKGDKGETGIVDVLYGTDDPPDPTGLAEGTIYIRYI